MVAVEPVLATIVFHVVPPSVDLSISYPVTGEPPSSTGAVQLRLICDDATAVAERFVGGCGGPVTLDVVADTVLDGLLVPTEFIAKTR